MKDITDSINEALSKGVFKGYETYKNMVLIPLDIKASKYNLSRKHEPKLTIIVGISIQEELEKFKNSNFEILILNDEVYLGLTSDGKLTVKVRSKSDANYLNSVITLFKKYTLKKIKECDW